MSTSIFDVLVSEVWSEAREDGGALLADFAPPSSDAARAARALRLPQLQRAVQALRQHASTQRGRDEAELAGQALVRGRRAAGEGRDVDAVRALSEAIRLSRCPALQLDAREARAHALVRLQEAEAGLQDLRAVRAELEARLAAPQGRGRAEATNTLRQYTKTLLAIASCLELQGDLVQAEATLREAMAAVRDHGECVEAADKAEVVSTVVRRLQESGRGRGGVAQARPTPPLVSSGLAAMPKLLAGAHPSMPAASAALEARSDERRGRHLVAAQDIPAGSALIVERPYAWSLSWEEMATHCLHCCSPVLASEPCPHCSDVVFCGTECRDAALSSYHRVECPVLRQLVAPAGPGGGAGGELSAMALLVFRIVVRAAGLSLCSPAASPVLAEGFTELHKPRQADGKKNKKKRKSKELAEYVPVFAQLTHSESRTPADLLKRSLTAAFLTRCLEVGLEVGVDEDQAALLTTAFLHHLQSCSCNAYQVAEQRLGDGGVRAARAAELGGACYPTVSLVNHACAPNVVRHSHAAVCVVRALHAIPKGGELLDNYGPHFLELEAEERRAALSRQYMFHCQCDACRLGWPTLEGLPDLPAATGRGRGKGHKKRSPSELAERLRAGLQGLLEGRAEEALQAALGYSSALQPPPQQPPCRERVRADQVATLCWSLAGNVVRC
ncbi:hypothetical protein ONE63_005595 [Megalurothrips usitatus]|uniref:SET domain-containing protein n=1 Tax=Megalurothrips usitatus TaxID=439358 RepID=A0AAV7XX28_9NEOP|nr:hypothetical protein ONE63_005595 [Megalurothrips usitatus]